VAKEEAQVPNPSDESEEDEVEGHMLPINPILAGDLARSRSADLDREARSRLFRREAKERQNRGR
jgi:hypothetical protein